MELLEIGIKNPVDFEGVRSLVQAALRHAESALETARTRALPNHQAVLQSQRMVEHLRRLLHTNGAGGFTETLSDLCAVAPDAPPEQLLSGITRALDRLAITIHLAAFAATTNSSHDQYLAWELSMQALEELSRQFRLVGQREIGRHLMLADRIADQP